MLSLELVCEAICHWWKKNGFGPTYDEISRMCLYLYKRADFERIHGRTPTEEELVFYINGREIPSRQAVAYWVKQGIEKGHFEAAFDQAGNIVSRTIRAKKKDKQ